MGIPGNSTETTPHTRKEKIARWGEEIAMRVSLKRLNHREKKTYFHHVATKKIQREREGARERGR